MGTSPVTVILQIKGLVLFAGPGYVKVGTIPMMGRPEFCYQLIYRNFFQIKGRGTKNK